MPKDRHRHRASDMNQREDLDIGQMEKNLVKFEESRVQKFDPNRRSETALRPGNMY